MDQVEKVQDRPKERSAEDGPPSVTVWEQCAKEVASLVRETALAGDQSEAIFNKALAAYVDLLKVSKVCKTIREAISAKGRGGGAAPAAAAESCGGQLTALPAPATASISGAIANQGAGGSTAAAKTVLPSGLASCKAPLPPPPPPPPPPITTSVWPVSFLNDCHDYCYFSDRRRRLRFGDDWYDSGEVYDDDDEDEDEEEEDWLDYDEDEEEEEDWLDYDEDDEGGEDVEVDDDEVIDYSKSATSGSGNGSRHKRARH